MLNSAKYNKANKDFAFGGTPSRHKESREFSPRPNAETLAAIAEVEDMIANGTGQHFSGSTADFLETICSE